VDKLFTPEATTEQIYQDLVANLIPFAQNGGVGTVFAYGQTGSGKTFTINRLQQLAIEALTAPSPSENNSSPPHQIQLSIIELAGNAAFDLLTSRKPISILEDSLGTIHLSGAASPSISNPGEALSLIDLASSFRRTASTLKNDASSRSHAICRIRITHPSSSRTTNAASNPAKEGFLYLVDLAGSEAARDVATHGADRMRETKEINMSLSVLKDCIRGRAEFDVYEKSERKGKKPAPRIPFRQSALTKVLKHVFDTTSSGVGEGGRGGRTVVIACVNPSLGDAAASKNTLRYAEMLRVVSRVDGGKGGGKVKEKGVMGWGNGEVREWILREVSFS
jgi:kinesin family member 2/24